MMRTFSKTVITQLQEQYLTIRTQPRVNLRDTTALELSQTQQPHRHERESAETKRFPVGEDTLEVIVMVVSNKHDLQEPRYCRVKSSSVTL